MIRRPRRVELRFGGRQVPVWLALVLFVVGAPLSYYGAAHFGEWPRRGPGGGNGANHLAVVAALVGGALAGVAVLGLGLRLARWMTTASKGRP
jgi:hypothetical protein